MLKNAFCLFSFLFVLTLQAQEWTQVSKYTKVMFTIKNFGVNVDGDFSTINVNTNIDTKDLSNSYIKADIVVNSVKTGIKKRDKSLLKKGYFNESKYQKITLKSTKITKNEEGVIQLFADLTIKGVTRNMEVPLTVLQTKDKITIRSKFQINRQDFDVGGGSLILSKYVNLEVEYIGVK